MYRFTSIRHAQGGGIEVICNEHDKPTFTAVTGLPETIPGKQLKGKFTDSSIVDEANLLYNRALQEWETDHKIFRPYDHDQLVSIIVQAKQPYYGSSGSQTMFRFNTDLEKGIQVDCIEIKDNFAYFKQPK